MEDADTNDRYLTPAAHSKMSDIPPTSIMANTIQCHLLRLPAELRHTIYEYSLVADGNIMFTPFDRNQAQQPSLTRTCRQIRDECTHLFYMLNTFEVQTRSVFTTHISVFMDDIGPNANHLRTLIIRPCSHSNYYKFKLMSSEPGYSIALSINDKRHCNIANTGHSEKAEDWLKSTSVLHSSTKLSAGNLHKVLMLLSDY